MGRIEEKFNNLSKEQKKALIVFLTCGYPDLETTGKLILELENVGVDLIELGVPFSDPIADGPIIQESSYFSLTKNKVNLLKVLELAKSLRKKTQIPMCLMSYYNPIFYWGIENFLKLAKSSQIDGVIIPDLPFEEAEKILRIFKEYSLDLIFFISPTTTRERIKKIALQAKGFIYYVSITGVTGPREELTLGSLKERIKFIKSLTSVPVCVGFGISSRKQVERISEFADGIIVGSALIKIIKQNLNHPDLFKKAKAFIKDLNQGRFLMRS